MDPRVNRLVRFVDDQELARKLVEAGYDTPKAIKEADDADLKVIEGIGPATVKAIRKRLRKR